MSDDIFRKEEGGSKNYFKVFRMMKRAPEGHGRNFIIGFLNFLILFCVCCPYRMCTGSRREIRILQFNS
jgi:hypothetical protein